MEKNTKVPPRFELGLLDSESRVLTVTPRNRCMEVIHLHLDKVNNCSSEASYFAANISVI